MLFRALILLALPVALAAADPEVIVCLENQQRLSPGALTSFKATLQDLGPQVGASVAFRCEDLRPPFVLLSFREQPRANQPEDALASMRTEDGKVLPRMELYLKPVRRMLPSRLEIVEGRALAWAAGHELLHYILQTRDHDHRGWFAAELNTAMLLVSPSRYRQK